MIVIDGTQAKRVTGYQVGRKIRDCQVGGSILDFGEVIRRDMAVIGEVWAEILSRSFRLPMVIVKILHSGPRPIPFGQNPAEPGASRDVSWLLGCSRKRRNVEDLPGWITTFVQYSDAMSSLQLPRGYPRCFPNLIIPTTYQFKLRFKYIYHTSHSSVQFLGRATVVDRGRRIQFSLIPSLINACFQTSRLQKCTNASIRVPEAHERSTAYLTVRDFEDLPELIGGISLSH